MRAYSVVSYVCVFKRCPSIVAYAVVCESVRVVPCCISVAYAKLFVNTELQFARSCCRIALFSTDVGKDVMIGKSDYRCLMLVQLYGRHVQLAWSC